MDPSSNDRRTRRLVSTQLSFRAEGEPGLQLEGFTTGVNQNGLAGRANLVAGEAESLAAGNAFTLKLNLESNTESVSPLKARVIRLEPSWIPGFSHFLVFAFEGVPEADLEVLKRFIEWREDRFFTRSKPERSHYVYSLTRDTRFGPLTAAEVLSCAKAGLFDQRDLAWSPEAADWVPLELERFIREASIEPAHLPPVPPLATRKDELQERRRQRYVASHVNVRVTGTNGVVLEGYSTGLNDHGIACRANLRGGESDRALVGMPVKIHIILPKRSDIPPLNGKILRVDSSWVPGFRYFVALKFNRIAPEAFGHLKRFIAWKEKEYFQKAKPERSWYLYSTAHENKYGPLTTFEVLLASHKGDIGPGDMIWSPERTGWIPFDETEFMNTAPDADDMIRRID